MIRLIKKREITPELLEGVQKGLTQFTSIINDQILMKDIIYSTFLAASHGTNVSMQNNGWEQLVKGSDMNENLKLLVENKAIYLYTQVLIALMSEIPTPSSP